MMTARVVRSIMSQDRKQLVEIFRRENDTFGLRALRRDEDDECFIPSGRYAESFSDSIDCAVAEASVQVQWLADSIRMGMHVETSDPAT